MTVAVLDVNALVALAWDSHVHHVPIRRWFADNAASGWATCPLTQMGFVRVSSNPRVFPSSIGADSARRVLEALTAAGNHRFLVDDVSVCDPDVPAIHHGHRQVTDVHLLVLTRRHQGKIVTFDRGLKDLAEGRDVELLTEGPLNP